MRKFKILLKRYDFIINIKKETMSSHFPEISNTMYICLYQLKKKWPKIYKISNGVTFFMIVFV